MAAIEYRFGSDLNLDQVIDLCNASTLGERRPVDDWRIMSEMLQHANLVVTAWDGELLIGIARTLTDFSYVGYLADLAVRESYQRQGIGIELMKLTREKMGPRSMLVRRAEGDDVLSQDWFSSPRKRLDFKQIRSISPIDR